MTCHDMSPGTWLLNILAPGTCLRTDLALQVLRRNKDSLMAVLEAFVYDPLLNWRLIDNKPKSKKSKPHGEVAWVLTIGQ